MKKLIQLTACSFLFILSGCSTGEHTCPANMHEQKLQDGTVICVPNHIQEAAGEEEN